MCNTKEGKRFYCDFYQEVNISIFYLFKQFMLAMIWQPCGWPWTLCFYCLVFKRKHSSLSNRRSPSVTVAELQCQAWDLPAPPDPETLLMLQRDCPAFVHFLRKKKGQKGKKKNFFATN